MKFNKFNSIENSYQLDFIASIKAQGFGHQQYIVQEKVHGANFSLIYNGRETLTAKRTGLIGENENFFNQKEVKERYATSLSLLFEHLVQKENIKTLTIFGELFGGGYPHPRVDVIKRAKLVQRGIYYSPQNEFYAFDILLDDNRYLDVNSSNELFQKFNFLCAKTLHEGSLESCLSYPNRFKSTIPSELKLPELDGNICEGVIIRPIEPLFFNNGSRVIIKNKNDDWSENNNLLDKEILKKLFHEGEALTDEAKYLLGEVSRYISKNRLSTVISKIGEINPKKDLGKVLGMFNRDILADFLKTYKTEYSTLEKHEGKAINKFVNENASKLVSEYFDRED
jgi:Rnl2 family RNA ligase